MLAPATAAPKRAKPSKPSIRERAAHRVCPNCGTPSPPRKSNRGPAPLYCDNDGLCKRQMNNRNLADGLALVPYLKAWRIDRGSGEIAQASFSRICDIVDELNDADRQADRPRADYYASVLLASSAQPVNELRYGRRKVAEARARAGEIEQPREPAQKPDELAALRAKVEDPKTSDNERAVLAAALEILSAKKEDAE